MTNMFLGRQLCRFQDSRPKGRPRAASTSQFPQHTGKEKHFCRYFGVELKCRELFSFKTLTLGFGCQCRRLTQHILHWLVSPLPLLCHSIFLSTQPAPDADSLGIGFNDSSTDSFVRTVELGNLRAVQGGSVHLVMERLRAGDWHLVFLLLIIFSSFAHHGFLWWFDGFWFGVIKAAHNLMWVIMIWWFELSNICRLYAHSMQI